MLDGLLSDVAHSVVDYVLFFKISENGIKIFIIFLSVKIYKLSIIIT